MNKVNKILKNDLGKSISSSYLLFFLNNIVALFLTPYILKFISKEEYGLYILCIDFLAWVSFLEFGTNKVVESKAGHLIAKGELEKLNISFNTSLFFQILISIVIFPLFFSLIYFGVDKPNIPHLTLIIIVFSISASLSVFKSLFSAIIIASKKIHLDNRIQLVTNVLNYLLILLLVPFIGVLGMAAITLLTALIMLYRSNYRIKKLFPEIHISFKNFRKEELKSLFSLGLYFSLGSIATLLLTKIDSFVIGREFGLETVASFYITIKLYMLLQKVFQIFLNNFRPHISQLFGKNDFRAIYEIYKVMFSFTFGFAVIIIALFTLLNEWFVNLWVGKEFYISDEFSFIFGLCILVDLLTIPSRIVLVSSLFEIKKQSYLRALEALGRMLFLVLFISKLNLIALPYSLLFSSFTFGLLFFGFQMYKYFKNNNIQIRLTEYMIASVCVLTFLTIFNYSLIIAVLFMIFFGVLFISFYFTKYNSSIKNTLAFLFK